MGGQEVSLVTLSLPVKQMQLALTVLIWHSFILFFNHAKNFMGLNVEYLGVGESVEQKDDIAFGCSLV